MGRKKRKGEGLKTVTERTYRLEVGRKYLPFYKINLSCSSRYHISYFHPSDRILEIRNVISDENVFVFMLAW